MVFPLLPDSPGPRRWARGAIVLLSVAPFGMMTLESAPAESSLRVTSVRVVGAQWVEFAVASGEAGTVSLQSSSDLQSWGTVLFTNTTADEVLFQVPTLERRRFYRATVTDGVSRVSAADERGWNNVVVLSNAQAEVLVVPQIDRVLQLKFVSDPDGPFWTNRQLDGQLSSANASDWMNFGGDKAWPAPQADWPLVTGSGWPPPWSLDSAPAELTTNAAGITLRSPVDPNYGIRLARQIELHPSDPLLKITTVFEQEARGARATNQLSVWTVTQLQDPEGVFALLGSARNTSERYWLLSAVPPTGLVVNGQLLSLMRDAAASHKVGLNSGSLVWIGASTALRIDSPRVPGVSAAGYPDNGSSAAIYTNPDPDAYVELEMLGPIQPLMSGEQISRTVYYHLYRRTENSALAEAQRILGVP